MLLKNYSLKRNSTGTGLDLYEGTDYLATYQSYQDCICDLSFHWSVADFDDLISMFCTNDISICAPFKYRAVCSELFCPLDKIHRFIYYGDSLQDILKKMEVLEKRSILQPEYFSFGVQGMGIHLFDESQMKYRLWLGGSDFHNVSDVILQAHNEKKFVPNELLDEMASQEWVEVFISHKSEDFQKAKPVYDFLVSKGISTFLSEISLPAMSNADYSAEIDKALDKTKHIIVIAGSKENVESGWVRYEWTTFANEKRSGRKNGSILTLLDENMAIDDLPILLRQYEVIPANNFKAVLDYIQ